MSETAASIMFVHGAWHGGWCWDSVRERLDALGVPSVAVDNPSVTRPGSDLDADVANTRAALDAMPGPVVLVGHSYGGAIISDAASHPNVAQVVFLTAFALTPGESVAANSLSGGEESRLGEAIRVDGATTSVDPGRAIEFFFHDCDPEIARAAVRRLGPMSVAAMSGTVRDAGWRAKPSSYIVCTDDRALPLSLQRSCAARTTEVIELATSHSPFLSRPDELARVLADRAPR